MTESHRLTEIVPETLAGLRLDQALAALFPDYSRARLTRWVKGGHVLVDGKRLRPRDAVHGGEEVVLAAEQEVETTWRAQDIPLDIVFEDEAVLVIDKPAGLVVHPGAGNMDGTLSNALLHYDPALEQVPRAGVVHRLDKDTSGLLVVARTLTAQKSLVEQLQARDVEREYLALSMGLMTAGGSVQAPIGRHPGQRLRQAVVPGGREAITHYRVEERFRAHSLLRVKLETGRTHQIRVHMAYLKYPLVGDPVYGGRLRIPAGATPALIEALCGFKRQALHAGRLGFEHPLSGESMSWRAPLPLDMAALVDACREDSKAV
ncbi:MAG TPA: 23S rRNA pseudouridine(1911/1915/1917) synthase RluD [Gammaproteobacteria bacterium]|nr:23S rRNA pseudouridine(1911/1915/1917) synthase RluD [Gammaproteobacteria bacterium]